jgi:hypothetical protein
MQGMAGWVDMWLKNDHRRQILAVGAFRDVS